MLLRLTGFGNRFSNSKGLDNLNRGLSGNTLGALRSSRGSRSFSGPKGLSGGWFDGYYYD